MAQKTLQTMFIEELRDIYSAERQIVRALPKLAKAASADDLRQALETHLEETRGQVERLDKVFETLDTSSRSRGKKCEAMEGMLSEANELLDLGLSPEALDSAIIAAAQKVEHYEIASYGSAIAWALALGYNEAADILSETLEEEKNADQILNKASRTVNDTAAEQVRAA
ncbi:MULTISPECIES: ferritin-like domain-containing protein [Nitrospirillum]|uniref:Ferritin-like domain-containing protein n=2 Tax=Nitrospirillum TaxID=1543705 RepID=A0A248K3T8_9PROT|nr:ferritin-like domain-containing protein [Nitrospirillum amazonense]ASG25449.1 ferritin-like domain-containing protein [Nitrospirillum amazonense CBAmc]MEC4590319.1 ferritin-like domain-containing protein [Nitrospirillum amazonense]TWB29753.1 ferritin-like metal-binding protein YciE [Nitrospirillum amazonense]TWB35332.1 ferritin-like metal-binding protein YciE [Nitrospirillum amazonense]TWB63989.1 ferritin-like metal-binding protein YciE [Nitrospirillum amazonense]